MLWWNVPLYNLTQTLYKLSLVSQSYRLFDTHRGRSVMKFILVWIVACGIMAVFASFFYCTPVAYAWDTSLNGTCLDRKPLNFSIASFNILNDLLLFAIPIPFLLTLQLVKRQRVLLLSVFSCAIL
jgi:predicted benzoate:H+ symporter BenE